MKSLVVAFTNFGPYHLARLRALAHRLRNDGGRLTAYEMAGSEKTYPWTISRDDEPFDWITLFPKRILESLSAFACKSAMYEALERDQPDGLGIVGYSRPETLAMLRWGREKGVPTVLMSESQQIDHPRVWWKEAVKRRRVKYVSAGLVGGPRHRDYLVTLGLPANRIALGYNAVDGEALASLADTFRSEPDAREELPARPYFLAVNRFVPEKNLEALIAAYSIYRRTCRQEKAWDLVLCGSGPSAPSIAKAVRESGFSHSIHLPGFLQLGPLSRWYAFASGFVHPSLMEPWGLVVNEAAACGLPLLVSERAGCVETFVPEEPKTGRRLNGRDVASMADALGWLARLPEHERTSLGENARAIAGAWGPERFASGALQAFEMAEAYENTRLVRS